jgi:probable rRNA maturation factor
MLDELGLSDAELSVLLTDDRTIEKLNREHRQKDRATDVLSFPLDEREANFAHRKRSGGRDLWLGDVVISLDTALRQARGRGRPLFEEVRFLLAHGLLHLIGYDHATAPQKKKMSSLTRQLVRAVKNRGSERAGAKTPANRLQKARRKY